MKRFLCEEVEYEKRVFMFLIAFCLLVGTLVAVFYIIQNKNKEKPDIVSLRQEYPYYDNIGLISQGNLKSIEESPMMSIGRAVIKF